MRKWHEGIEQVREMRRIGKSLGEICLATGVSKATVYGWIKDMPVPVVDGVDIRTRAKNKGYWTEDTLRRRVESYEKTWKGRRDAAYQKGCVEAKKILKDRTVRDFLCLYLAEGDKRDRGQAVVVNTDPGIMRLAYGMLNRLSGKNPSCRVIGSRDEKDSLIGFWAETLGVKESEIRFSSKKKINGRRAEYGLMSVRVCDTYFKCRLTAWIDRMKQEWEIVPVV